MRRRRTTGGRRLTRAEAFRGREWWSSGVLSVLRDAPGRATRRITVQRNRREAASRSRQDPRKQEAHESHVELVSDGKDGALAGRRRAAGQLEGRRSVRKALSAGCWTPSLLPTREAVEDGHTGGEDADYTQRHQRYRGRGSPARPGRSHIGEHRSVAQVPSSCTRRRPWQLTTAASGHGTPISKTPGAGFA